MDPWARNTPKSEPDVKRLPLSELPCLFSVPEAGSVPTSANEKRHDISSEGDRPSDHSNDEEWDPDEVDQNAVTLGNMSIDSKPVATDGERGRYREITVDSGAGDSVVNPDDWPNIDLKQSKGSVKRLTIWEN